MPFRPRADIESMERRSASSCMVTVTYRKGDKRMRHQAMWVEVNLRKPARCCRCSSEISAGETAFAPVTNWAYRGSRICHKCIPPEV